VIRRLFLAVLGPLNWVRQKLLARGLGVLALPLTAEGKLVMVQLTYARGWHLPGGGVRRGESPRDGALRELREEIGMTHHGEVARVESCGRVRLFLVRNVRYSPSRNLEVSKVGEFALEALPPDATPLTRRLIASTLTPA
jgi:8-oxo-dGTP pyrophosphatase MutT (NUDIX family)